MSLDLGSPAIEIAIALAFVFFLLSLIASAITEAAAALFKFRSRNLKKGLQGMLGDEEVAGRLFGHPLVRTDLRPGERRDPSYISPRNFALAFLDTVDVSKVGESLARQLTALSRSKRVALPDVPALERWFDESMDRISGLYRRKAQRWTFVIAAILAVGLNVSTLRMAQQLSAEPSVRAAIVAKAEAAAKEEGKVGQESDAADELKEAGKAMETAVDKLADLKLPIFWAGENVPQWSWAGIGSALVGWLITALAVSLGAPFWFDALNKLSNLRLTGKKPGEKAAGGAG
jgi:hypothetical protein